jgi:hypothetical protein
LNKKKNFLPPSAECEKIDEIVYGLYGVKEEERKIIEGISFYAIINQKEIINGNIGQDTRKNN